MNESLSSTATLLGDPGRAAILLRLMGGVALPAGELAATANVAPQTASEHLAKLVAGRFLTVERQGRHRYDRLAAAEIADAIEALLVLTARPSASRLASNAPPIHGTIEHARICYGHLAGWLGVRVARKSARARIYQGHAHKSLRSDALRTRLARNSRHSIAAHILARRTEKNRPPLSRLDRTSPPHRRPPRHRPLQTLPRITLARPHKRHPRRPRHRRRPHPPLRPSPHLRWLRPSTSRRSHQRLKRYVIPNPPPSPGG